MRPLCGDLIGCVRRHRHLGAGDLRRVHVHVLTKPHEDARDRVPLLIRVLEEAGRDDALAVDDERAGKRIAVQRVLGVGPPGWDSRASETPITSKARPRTRAFRVRRNEWRMAGGPLPPVIIPIGLRFIPGAGQNRSTRPPEATTLWTDRPGVGIEKRRALV